MLSMGKLNKIKSPILNIFMDFLCVVMYYKILFHTVEVYDKVQDM